MIFSRSLYFSRRYVTQCKGSRHHFSSGTNSVDGGTTHSRPGLGGLTPGEFSKLCETGAPFAHEVLGLKVVNMKKGQLIMKLEMKPSFIGKRQGKVLHGGVAAAAIDHVGGFAAWTALEDSSLMISTVDLRIDYLSPAPYETLLVTGNVVSVSKKLIRCDITVRPEHGGQACAIGRGLFNVYAIKGFDMKRALGDPNSFA